MSEEAAKTVIRAFELPLHRPPGHVWPIINEGWKKTVELANWSVEQLRRLDEDAIDEHGKLRKLGEVDLYARAFGREKPRSGRKDVTKVLPARKAGFRGREFFAGGGMREAAGVIRDVEAEYRGDRFEVHVRRSKSFRQYREYPWTLNGQSVQDVWLDGNGRPWARLTLPGGQVELQMRNGRDFVPQMVRFHDLVRRKGDGLPFKEVVIREKRCRDGYAMIKFVCEVPVQERPASTRGQRPLVLTTSPDCFWRADFIREGVGERCFVRAWVLNNDHWRRVAARHDRHLDALFRMSQDAKAERRMIGTNRADRDHLGRLDLACEKDRNRLASFTHEAAAHLANFCDRSGVGEVYYLDRDQGFMSRRHGPRRGEPLPFPWHELHRKLAQKLEQRGVALYSESGFGSAPSAVPERVDPEGEIITTTTTEDDGQWLRLDRLLEMAGRKVLEVKRRRGSLIAATAP